MVIIIVLVICAQFDYIGTELCTVVETMYSYEVLFGVTGDTVFGELMMHR